MRIIADNVRKSFGAVTAVDGLSLEIPDGASFGILGTNGAGKTTLFEMLVGLQQPDSGRLVIGGREVAEEGPSIRTQVGYLPERIGFPGSLTGREVLEFHCRMRGLPCDGRIDEAFETIGLSRSDADRAVDGYSNGMRRRLGLASAVLAEPSVLILDEPTAGLDPRGVAEFHRVVQRAKDKTDATVVLASHVLSEVDRICDRVAILEDGRTVAAGRVGDLVSTGEVTVRLRPVSAGRIETLEAVARDFGAVSIQGDTIVVDTDVGEVSSLYAAVDSRVELAETTVEHQGLEEVFHRAIGSRPTVRRADG